MGLIGEEIGAVSGSSPRFCGERRGEGSLRRLAWTFAAVLTPNRIGFCPHPALPPADSHPFMELSGCWGRRKPVKEGAASPFLDKNLCPSPQGYFFDRMESVLGEGLGWGPNRFCFFYIFSLCSQRVQKTALRRLAAAFTPRRFRGRIAGRRGRSADARPGRRRRCLCLGRQNRSRSRR